MRTFRIAALSLLLAAPAAISACRSGNPYDINNRQASDATLIVENQNFSDVDVYALSGGLPTRIGTVPGNSTLRFALNSSVIAASDFRLIATPIGGNGRGASGLLVAAPGQTIKFTVAPVLNQSFAQIL
jgi:hypothetical protein